MSLWIPLDDSKMIIFPDNQKLIMRNLNQISNIDYLRLAFLNLFNFRLCGLLFSKDVEVGNA